MKLLPAKFDLKLLKSQSMQIVEQVEVLSNHPQVQAIYQRCSTEPGAQSATCTCAVAVKSGDDVFVVDRCRRTGQTTDDDTVMRAVMFVNGDVTPGTRVFSQAEGADMKVSK